MEIRRLSSLSAFLFLAASSLLLSPSHSLALFVVTSPLYNLVVAVSYTVAREKKTHGEGGRERNGTGESGRHEGEI